MAIRQNATIYSYREAPAIPEFDDSVPVAFMDGNCMLCSQGARVIARFDRSGTIRICPIQTPLGSAMLRHYGMDPEDPDSWLFLRDGKAFASLQGIIETGRTMGGIFGLARILYILPAFLQNWIYNRIARNRYSLFGRTDMCSLPDERLKARLMQPAAKDI